MSAAAAFDQLASRYDEQWTCSVVGRLQREAVWRTLGRLFSSGERVLELGCGTGEDAVRLARNGVRVHATDAAPRMVEITRRRVESGGLGALVTSEALAAENLEALNEVFDGAIANFGVLNCVKDLGPVAAALARLVRPEGRLALCLMGRFCAWETLWYLLRGHPGKAFRRWKRGGALASVDSSRPFCVYYPSVRQLRKLLEPHFRLVEFRGIGVFVPPGYVQAPAGLCSRLDSLDRVVAGWPVLRAWGDHRLLVFSRNDSPQAEVPSRVRQKSVAPLPHGRGSVQAAKSTEPRASASGCVAPLPRAAMPQLLCPSCSRASVRIGEVTPEGVECPCCGFSLRKTDGIIRAIAPSQQAAYRRFLNEYAKIRAAEGRGSEDAAYHRALPYEDLSGRNTAQWAMRARTYRYFEARLLPAEPSDILDLGAGNGWMSYRLAQRDHRPVAVDIRTDALDGLGAAARHFGSFPLIEAEFDRLPFVARQFDLAVFNASFHYSTDYRRTLAEIRRCLRPGGRVVILDSPIYRRPEHGEQMRAERHAEFEKLYGFRSDSLPSREYLYDSLLRELSEELGVQWRIHRVWYGWRWFLRPWKARLLGKRPPSRFWILVGTFKKP